MLACASISLTSLAAAAQLGHLAWSWDSGTSVEASPALITNNGSSTVLIADYGGAVTGLIGSSGKRTGLRFYEGEMIRSTPAVFTFPSALTAFFFVAGDGKLYSVDAGSGKLLWSVASGVTGAYQASSPAVHDFGNGAVYVYVGSVKNSLYAFDANNGTAVWALPTGGPIYSSPKVRSLSNGSVAVVVGSDDGVVYTADALTGSLWWQFQTAAMMRGSFNFTDTANGTTVFFGSNDNNVYARDLATGAPRWSFATGGYVTSTPQVYDNNASFGATVYIGSYDYNVYALDASTGVVRWIHKTVGSVIASPTVVETSGGPRIYVGCDATVTQSLFYAIDAIEGHQLWTYYVEDAPIWSTAVAVDNSVVVFGDQTGVVWALSLP